MFECIKRILADARPVDVLMLVIELLVLLVIGFEAIAAISRRIRTTRRSERIFQLLQGGQAIQHATPIAGTADEGVVIAWVESVKSWIEQTTQQLSQYSQEASASFLHDSGGASVNYGGVSGLAGARNWYATLQARLNNLRNIMEKPDVYF